MLVAKLAVSLFQSDSMRLYSRSGRVVEVIIAPKSNVISSGSFFSVGTVNSRLNTANNRVIGLL